MDTLYII